MYYLLIRCLDYGFLAFVGFAPIFNFIASAWNYYSYVLFCFLIASACVNICYILYLSKISAIMFEKKASIFPFLFRDIFWRWAGSEATLILEGHV